MKKWKIAGIYFAHMHMGDNLRMAWEHPQAEIVGICDENSEKMEEAVKNFNLNRNTVYTDYRKCLEEVKPDIVILCPPTAQHADWVEKLAPFGVNIILEKPFAATLKEADRCIAAIKKYGKMLAVNWPLAWYPPHVTTKSIIREGVIGKVKEVHFYDGNRGPLWHLADKVETTAETVEKEKPYSWFYKKSAGGGSLLDYLGYGTTLGTWYHDGEIPEEVITVVDEPSSLEVDEHSITIARYASGLSKFETRWGTFTDPWTHQPQPKCGFVIIGTDGTISSYDFENTIKIQTRENPEGFNMAVDQLKSPYRNPIEYIIHCLETGSPVEGPLSPEISRIGQMLVDAAFRSGIEKTRVKL